MKSIYSVYDNQTKTFNMPFFAANDPTALRSFKNEANRADAANTIYTNPEDFSLVKLGTFNEDTGEIQPVDKPELIAKALTLVQKKD